MVVGVAVAILLPYRAPCCRASCLPSVVFLISPQPANMLTLTFEAYFLSILSARFWLCERRDGVGTPLCLVRCSLARHHTVIRRMFACTPAPSGRTSSRLSLTRTSHRPGDGDLRPRRLHSPRAGCGVDLANFFQVRVSARRRSRHLDAVGLGDRIKDAAVFAYSRDRSSPALADMRSNTLRG